MLVVDGAIAIPDAEFEWSYARSGGPGGQNVNKVASKAILRWALDASPSLPDAVKTRLRTLQRNRITTEGDLIVTSELTRDQERNREDCLIKLATMIRAALIVPKPRKATKPSKGSKQRRLAAKKHHSARKSSRRGGFEE
ncbi:MAG: alternative ribosome rescue aminoacyl-tRNA hydrolase ArfB [Gemmataceae bacterium]